jgi:hypothetical protein
MEEKILAVEPQFEQSVSFGYADCDEEPEYVRDTGITNVPSIAYYQGAKVFGVVIGVQQDVAENIRRLIHGDELEQTNKLSRG